MMMRATNSTLSSVCTVCVCIKACTHLSLSVCSILHARLHSSQPVCRHRNTGQLSEYPPADTGTPPTSLILLTSSHSPCPPPPLVFSSYSLITCCKHACTVLWVYTTFQHTANAGMRLKGQACYWERRPWYRVNTHIITPHYQWFGPWNQWWSTAWMLSTLSWFDICRLHNCYLHQSPDQDLNPLTKQLRHNLEAFLLQVK